ncbi:MAG TPA: DUF3261 domain-containing protein [Herbaspirillum sp.]|jgi:hypothetical protein
MQATVKTGRRSLPSLAAWPTLLLTLPILLLALAGCSSLRGTAAQAPKPPPARLGLKLSPASLGQTLSLQQHMKVERAGRTDELDTALEIDPDQLTLVGLAFGQRVMTLEYDGKELKTWRHFMLPPQVRGEDVLEDMQLTLWPAQAIRAALPAGWDLRDSAPVPPGAGWQRILSFEGETIMTIDYAGKQRWGGQVVLNNLRYHYKLTITSAAGDA